MKYSVIIPLYNKRDTVATAIDSVLSGSVQDLELIVVDDGSCDDPGATLSAYGDRIRVFRQENAGVSAARNRGMREARGTYICFLDADDRWLPHHLATLDRMMAMYPGENMYITSHIATGEEGEIHSNRGLSQEEDCFLVPNLFDLLNRVHDGIFNTNSVCLSRAFLQQEDLWFAVGEKIGEDTDMWFRVALYGPVVFSRVETTVYRREHSTAIKENGTHTFTWIFARRWEEWRTRPFDDARRSACDLMVDRHKLNGCRLYLAVGDRAAARTLLREVRNRHGRRYHLTRLLFCLPRGIVRRLLHK